MAQERGRSLPPEIVAIDWGATPAKRQLCRAVLRGGRYGLARPEPVPDPATLELPDRGLVAFDCALGLPQAYADRAQLGTFREALARFGHGDFARFYEPATTPEEISTERPFYPAKSPGAKREQLQRALGEAAFALRACDRATGAGPLFWLVGARQVGRSSVSVWRDVVTPRLTTARLWPFDGPLQELGPDRHLVLAEIYPAFLQRVLGLDVTSKRDPAARAEAGRLLVERTRDVDLVAVRDLLLSGFGPSPNGEDAFDAVVSCLALVRLLLEERLPEPPPEARAVEGWILGL